MPSVNEALLDEAISHQIDLARYTNGVVERMVGVLNRTDKRLMAELEKALARLPATSFTVERLEAMLGSVRALNAQAYAQLGQELQRELQDFVQYEAAYQGKLLETALPVQVSVSSITAEQVYTAALARPFQGALLKGWLDDMEADKAKRIRRAVAQGYVEGKTTAKIVQEMRGTRAKGFSDGIIEITRRNAESVTRTALSHMAGVTRDRFYEANSDILKAVGWVATLDGRTTPECRVRDGKQYTPVDHKPIGHKLQWGGGPGRLHWCCRSASFPIVKSLTEMGLNGDEFTPTTRASMDGQVPAQITYSGWLKKQHPRKQAEILGKDRAALFRTGKLPIEKFQDDKGKTLTLKELHAIEPAAYHKAGLDLPYRPPRAELQDEIAIFLASKKAQQQLLLELYGGPATFESNLRFVEGVKGSQGYTATGESLAAVRYYTGSGYRPINQRMRGGVGTLQDRQFMSLTVSSLPGVGEFRGTVWRAPTQRLSRGDEWWSSAKAGELLDLGNQLQSFSSSGDMAANWSGSSSMLFRVKSNKIGAYIDPLSQHPGEDEVLLPPGLKYRVAAKTTEMIHGRAFRVIDLEIEQ